MGVDRKNHKSLFLTILIPLIIVMVVQSGLFYLTTVFGGVAGQLDKTAEETLYQQLNYQKNNIESMIHSSWTQVESTSNYINELYDKYNKEYGKYSLINDKKRSNDFLKESSDILIETLRNNKVNGVFLILNDQKDFVADKTEKMGLGIRDKDVLKNYWNNEDLLIVRSPVAFSNVLNIPFDSLWEPNYNWIEDEGDYFFHPLKAGYDYPNVEVDLLGYFSKVHCIYNDVEDVVSYSVALRDENNFPYAVLGMEISTRHLLELAPLVSIGNNDDSSFVFGFVDDGQKFEPILSNGGLFRYNFDTNKEIELSKNKHLNLIGRNQNNIYATYEDIKLYPNISPFGNQKLVVMAMKDENALYRNSDKLVQSLLITSFISLVVGVLGIMIVSRLVTKPISKVSKEALAYGTGHLKPIGIKEIDKLINEIDVLNRNSSKESARLEFFSRMSHDMRTPMNAIIGFSSPLLLDNVDEETKDEYLSKINSSAAYLLGLINDVLDITKIESNKVTLQYENVEYLRMFDTIKEITNQLASKRNIEVLYDIQQDSDLILKIDRQHINQIVLNLLSNAIKFSKPDGKVEFSANITKNNVDNVDLQIIVKDYGVGISKEYLSKIFVPFEQEYSSYGGTGLGLSITKKLVELMDGEIYCDSIKDEGTTFTINMKIDKEDKSIVVKKEYSKDFVLANTNLLANKKVLLCEDHPMNVMIIRKILEKFDMIVDVGENGEKGVEIFVNSKEYYYDFILMDIRMPVMDGLQATKIIRSLNRNDSLSIAIFALTANAFGEDIKQSKDSGMNDHFSKPIEQYKLLGSMIDWIISKNN